MDLSACEATIVVSEETRLQVATMLAILEAAKQVLQQNPQLAQALNEVAAANAPVSQTLTDPGEPSLRTNVQNAATGGRRSASRRWWRRSLRMSGENEVHKEEKWLENTRGTLMIVAILIATVTFQAALNPPGGFWQDPKGIDTISPVAKIDDYSHLPGTSINGDMQKIDFKVFMLANTVGLLASLTIILVSISATTSLRGIFLTRLLVIIMWVAILAMGLAFYFGAAICSPNGIWKFMAVPLYFSALVIVLLFLGNIVCFLCWCPKRLWGILKVWWLLKKGWRLLKKGWGILRGMCTRGSSCSHLGCYQV